MIGREHSRWDKSHFVGVDCSYARCSVTKTARTEWFAVLLTKEKAETKCVSSVLTITMEQAFAIIQLDVVAL